MKIPIPAGSAPLAGALTLCILLGACRKNLCYNHEEHSPSVKVEAHLQWEQEWEYPHGKQWQTHWPIHWETNYESLRPVPGKGIRSAVYAEGKGMTESNLSAEGGQLNLPEGRSSLLFYNSDTEYIVFNHLEQATAATATTRSVQRNGFRGLHEGERTMNPPDMLYGHFEADYEAKRTLKPVDYQATLHPRVFTYLIRYEFAYGKQYIALARGALAGMAEYIYLHDGHSGTETATILFDAALTDYGVEARVKTFGAPGYSTSKTATFSSATETRYTVNLEVRLTNGQYKQFEVDVSSQLREQPRGGVIQIQDLEITDQEGETSGGTFDATVEGWGERIDIPLPL